MDNPYVGYGHKLLPGERYSARTMTKRQADALLRKDLRKFCAMFRQFGKDSLLLATLAYNVGPYRLLGSGKIPKSTLIRKLEAGDRNIYREYIAFCNYKGKRHAMLLKRRKAEFALLYIRNRFQWHLSSGYSKNLNAIVSNKTITFVISNLEIK